MPALAIDYIDQKTDHKFHFHISVFKKPRNAKEYSKLEKILDALIDEVRNKGNHPLAIIMQIVGENLEQYDTEHHPAIGENISDIDMVKHLMEIHNLRQSDLANIFGGQANVSRFLNGDRPLSKKQIAGLKKRFGISADFFVK
ncbi:MAG: type II toxin-antitoxin system HigA family antitoxin [Nitrososphaerales archaeon]